MKHPHYNEVNRFANPAHEALMGVWWSGLKLKRAARTFFRAHAVSDTQFNALVVLNVAGRPLSQREMGERLLVDRPGSSSAAPSRATAAATRCRSPPPAAPSSPAPSQTTCPS